METITETLTVTYNVEQLRQRIEALDNEISHLQDEKLKLENLIKEDK